MTLEPCPGCGGDFPDEPGPVHAYVPSSPGCWRAFGELQAEEMRRFRYPDAHRLVVDAYMAQHPGDGSDRRDRQSVFLHLLALCALLEHDAPPAYVRRLIRAALARTDDFPHLERTGAPGELTVLHMTGTSDLGDYEQRARAWAVEVWRTWESQHDTIRAYHRSAWP